MPFTAFSFQHERKLTKTCPPVRKALLIMKLIAVFLFAACMQVFAEAHSQTVTLSVKNAPFQKVLKEIRKQTGYNYICTVEMMELVGNVSVDAKNVSLQQALEECLQKTPLTFTIVENTIVIKRKVTAVPTATVTKESPPPADITVKGKVTDESGTPLPGASVNVKGTGKGVNTDSNGDFSISVPDNSAMILVISFVGMETKEISVKGLTSVQVTLSKQEIQQQEIVVVGYGTQKKATVTGAVAQVGAKVLQSAPVPNTSQLLVGRMPGLLAKTAGGLPGEDNASLQIRGYGTALVIVDGLPTPFNRIDPNDIESVSILKDASAAIYGARAGNGVILVTTKRGKTGAPQITYSGTYTYQMPSAFQKTVNAGDWAELRREAALNYGLNPGEFTEDVVQKYKAGNEANYKSYNWRDAIFRTGAPMMQQSITVSGGTPTLKYFGSLGITNQQSVFTSGDYYYKRYNSRLNVDATIAKNLSLRFDMQYRFGQDQQVGSIEDVMVDFSTAQPRYNPYLPDPTKNAYTGFQSRNPLLRIDAERKGYNRTSSNFFNGQIGLNYKIPFVEGLRLGADLLVSQSADYTKVFNTPAEVYDYDYDTKVYTYMANMGNFITLRETNARYFQVYPMLKVNYDRDFGNHRISAMGIAEQLQNGGNSLMAFRRDLLSPSVQQLYSGGQDFQDNTGTQSQMSRVAYIGKVNYDYAGKYLAEFILRADASANFPKNSRWGYFPGVSVGWVFSKEKFMDNASSWLTNGKLRLSYGQSGNDGTSQFSYLTGYDINAGGYIMGSTYYKTITTTGLPNPDITWESITNYNAGIDLTLWKGKLVFEGNVFYRLRDGILASQQRAVPSTFGATLPPVNLNKQSNRGFELMIDYRPKIRGVQLSIMPTFTFTQNKWEYRDETAYTDPDQIRIYKLTGKSTNLSWGYKSDGIFMSQAEIDKLTFNQDGVGNTTLRPGDIRYVDLNKDGILDWRDQDKIGKGTFPEVVYSLVLGATYKGLSLEMLWQGSTGFNFYVTGAAASMFSNESIPYDYHYTYRWQPDPANPTQNINPKAQLPAASLGLNPNNIKRSDFWMKDATFIRLRNVNLSYSFSGNWTKKLGFKNLQVFASATNLLTFSRLGFYKNTFDPDANLSGEGRNYPIHKNIAGGVRLTF
ncbi:TonB-linked SusC/RagA family outer membrane protein [Lacibacter cauensis]|uniref:TonB-linked SusC/RagA family outer membrane protein n=2 Tax=Lacibacter cauensis TaxID=510947 RepID=A0A562SRE4_9BACT|nr:TonB-linked SusC/RagA family outer membrane protein [Lacibacter cauensis]